MLVRVGPRAGRVVVELSGALRNYLVECATTLAGTAKQLAEMSEQQRSQLPPLAAGDWKSAAASATTWADRLSRLAETEVGGRVSDRSKTLDPLTQIDKWCQTLPSADHPILRAFRFADEHACRAAGLMTGPESSSSPGP